MGCLSFVVNLRIASHLSKCLRRSTIVLGLLCLGWSLLATSAQAQTPRFGPRAGSKFSETRDSYGQTSRRPYRRRQKPVRRLSEAPAPKFDYRLETAESPDAAFLAAQDEYSEPFQGEDFEQDYVDPASFQRVRYCDGGDDCCDGSCAEPVYGCDNVYEAGCGCDDYCEPGCGCEDSCYPSTGGRGDARWNIGFEWSFVKPRYSENIAFTTMTGDGANNSTFTDTEFDYDLELTPRVWIEAPVNKCWSWRVSYWQYDDAPSTASTSPNANGFGEITHPAFGDVDISTTIPTDAFTASSDLNAYTIDVEALKQARLSGWQLGVGGGVRYASTEQNYFAQLRNTGNVLRGQIDFSHELEGFGPTISLSARRPLAQRIKLVCAARGSLLFGDGSSRLVAGEDLDLANPFTTTRLTNREDLLPISEARVGLEWMSPKKRRSWQWMLSTAMEGQVWGNAGNASSETADLGFFGFNVGAGFLR